MCTAEGAAVLNVVGSVLKFQDKKEQAATTRINNTIARNEYNKGYLADVTEIDGNIQDAKDEKTVNIVKNKIEKINAMAKQLNLNVGNSGAIMKDIGAEYQLVEQDNDREFGIDMKTAYTQYDKAYASFTQAMNNLPVPQEPSMLGLALDVAGAGVQYKRDQKALA